MKKLLSLLGATSLVATTSAAVVACGPDNGGLKINSKLTLVDGKTTSDVLKIVDQSWDFNKNKGIFEKGYKDRKGLPGLMEGHKGTTLQKKEDVKELFNETKNIELELKSGKHFFSIQANAGESKFRIFLFERYSNKDNIIAYKQLSTIELDAKDTI